MKSQWKNIAVVSIFSIVSFSVYGYGVGIKGKIYNKLDKIEKVTQKIESNVKFMGKQKAA